MGTVHLYTGSGKGKTSAALGIALRALGHGQKVSVIQFLKSSENLGEFKAASKIRGLNVHQFGRKGFNAYSPEQQDHDLALSALAAAEKRMKEKPHLLILDEINTAMDMGLVNTDSVIALIKKLPKSTHLYLTGTNAPQELLRYVDFWTDVTDRKRVETNPRKGIEW